MADDTSNKPYPFQFDPSQWSNPYSRFYGQALPFPPTYAGTPTNALGQPIAAPPGMTLNSTPQQPQAPAPDATAMRNAVLMGQPGAAQAYGANFAPPGSPGGIQGLYGRNFAAFTPQGSLQGAAQPAAQPAQAAAPNNWQSTLSMLANPGPVTTPGATVPQAPPGGGQPSPGVLQNFLANWQPAQSGPGAGFTQNFNTILRGLQSKGS